MVAEYVMGLDLGTTSVKACVYNLNGKVVAEAEEMLTIQYPQQGWAEQDPVQIERLAVLAVRRSVEKAAIGKDELIAIGFSAAQHSIVCVNAIGKPISPGIIWSDGRSYPQAERVLKTNGSEVYFKTGTPIHPMTPFLKLLWMKEMNYEPYRQAQYFMSIKEYVFFSWFKKRVIDYSMAAATGLLNAATLDWEGELLNLTGVKREQLSEIVPPIYLLNGIDSQIAEEMGIRRDLPFVIGGGDAPLSNLGIGAILQGEAAINVGTSGAIRQFTKEVKMDPKQEIYFYSFSEDAHLIGGPTNNGGNVLQWLKDLLNDQRSFEEFLKEAEQVAPGSEGLLFLPYLNGERAPLWNQRSKGNFYGVTITHKRQHLIRAVLEGITFNLYQIGKALERIAGEPKKLYVNGGLSRSRLWLQMLADVFDAEIYVPESHQSSSWGAAWVALVALGKEESLEDIKKNIPMREAVVPNKDNRAIYKFIYEKYEKLVKDIEKHF